MFKDANQRLKELEQNADKLAKFSDSLVQRVNRVNAIRRSRFLPPVVRPVFSIGDGDKVTIAQVKEYAVNARVSANELKKSYLKLHSMSLGLIVFLLALTQWINQLLL